MRKVIACWLTASLLSGGCYAYREPPATGVSPGQEVHVSLTDAGTAAVAPLVGPSVAAINGRVLSSADTALALAVSSTEKRNGVEDLWRGEQVLVRREYIGSLQQRALSRTRTLVAGGALVALGAILYGALGGVNGSSNSGGGGGGGPR